MFFRCRELLIVWDQELFVVYGLVYIKDSCFLLLHGEMCPRSLQIPLIVTYISQNPRRH